VRQLHLSGESILRVFLQLNIDPNRFTGFSFYQSQFPYNDKTRLSPGVFNRLLDFLAKAQCLKDLSLSLITGGDQMDRLWTVLAQLPNLNELQLGPKNFQQLHDPSPLKMITHLTLTNRPPAFDFERVFPSLVDFHWLLCCDLDMLNFEHLTQVTRITSGRFNRSSFFNILSHLPHAKSVYLTCYNKIDLQLLQPFEHQSLTKLNLTCLYKWTFSELKAVFSFFPNLIELYLTLPGLGDAGLDDDDDDFDDAEDFNHDFDGAEGFSDDDNDDFDGAEDANDDFDAAEDVNDDFDGAEEFIEQNFINFLQENRPRFSNLRILTLCFKKAPATMTARSVIAIVRNFNLDEFNWLTEVPTFTTQEQEELKSVALQKNQMISPIFTFPRGGLFSQETSIRFECVNGKHFNKGKHFPSF
jgi:hypothetical protein